MKKILIILLILPCIGYAQGKKQIDGFWGISFGSSQEDAKTVMATKEASLEKSDPKFLKYNTLAFSGRPLYNMYLNFVDGKFYVAYLAFPASDEVAVIGKFNTIIDELNAVYGKAKVHKEFQTPYTEGDGYEVLAIQSGKATYYAKWTSDNKNTIQLQINKDLTMNIFYTDVTLEKLVDAKKSSDY